MIKVEINQQISELEKSGKFAMAFEASTEKDLVILDILSSVFNSLSLDHSRAGFIRSNRLVVHLAPSNLNEISTLMLKLTGEQADITSN